MPSLLWSPLSISYLVELILVSMITGYFSYRIWIGLRSSKGWHANGALFVTFSALFASILMQFLKVSVHPDYTAFLLAWVSPPGALSLCGYVQFAYLFPAHRKQRSWEARIVMVLSFVFVGLEIAVAFERHAALMQGYVDFRPAWMDLPYVIGFFYALLTFLRHMVRAIAKDQSQGLGRATLSAGAALLWIWKPLCRPAAAARAFLLVTLLPLLLTVVFLLRSYGIISAFYAELSICWIFLLLISGFALVFLNYVPDHSSYRVKLVGITLTTMLTIMGGVAWLIGPIYIQAYENENLVREQTAIRFEPVPEGGYSVARTSYHYDTQPGERVTQARQVIELPFTFPFFGESYDQLYVRENGFVGFDYPPLWQDITHRFGPQPALYPLAVVLDDISAEDGQGLQDDDHGLFVKMDQNRLVLTWKRLVSPFYPDNEYTFQLVLYPKGVIEFHYVDLPETVKSDLFISYSTPMVMGITPGSVAGPVQMLGFTNDLPLRGMPGVGLMENYRLNFLLYLDRIYAPLALFILGTSLFILIVFPVFFRISLDRPLAKLLGGVQEFRKGDLSIAVPVAYRDEIGFLTQSFNEMAHTQNDLVNTLEDKVAQRTAEATGYAAENARLEERNHLSRELHDAVSQTLFSATLIADTLPELWQKEPERAEQALGEMRQLNRSALSEMRLLLLELRPTKIFEQSFGKLLREIAEEFERKNPVATKIQIESDLILPESVQITFYRIAQECLSNIAKHADTKEVSLYFDGVATQAMLVVTDYGQGFDLDDVPIGHMGLQIMKERVEKIGGSLEIETAPGKGTVLTVIWFKNETD